MNKAVFLLGNLIFACLYATRVHSQIDEASRQILQQYQRALVGESEQPLKCGFTAHGIMHTMAHLDPTMKNLFKISESRPRLPLSYVTPSSRFRFHYTLSGDSAVARASTITPNVPDYVYEAGLAAERAYHVLVDSLGFAPHADDDNVDGPEYDFYIVNFRGSQYGYTDWNFLPPQERGPAFSVIDNDYAEFATRGLEGLRVTVAHEYFHGVQLNIRIRSDDLFFFEMSSTWFEDVAYDHVNDYLNYLPRWFRDISLPLYTRDGWHEYGSCIWLHYLVKRLEPERFRYRDNIVYNLWQRIKQESALAAMTTVLRSPSFTDALGEFYEWCFFTGTRADSVQYFDEGRSYPQINFRDRTFAIKHDTTIDAALFATTAHYYQVTRTGQSARFFIQPSVAENEVALWRTTAITRENAKKYSLQRINGLTSMDVEAPAKEDTVAVVVVNASPTATGSQLPPLYKLQVLLLGQQRLVNALEKPFPNPFRLKQGRMLVVPFRIRQRMRVEAAIFREDGNVVKRFDQFGELPAGPHRIIWDGVDESGKRVASGVYFLRLLGADFHETTKFVVIN
ncbi:MAG: hypothetical protein ONB44_08935 [candidate division KSB1 bacterium]|nr:hypothetical protein [candidate division KSB1 bacterium]MDZ7302256.1 hypothetical protein [candidate division KSB1 bacterium]MDZ7311362.1 hypothetical protein [candidate division KSB1 bacterium]